jgi:regulator of sigma E protease
VIKFTLFFLSLSLLIILHEFGHYITARIFKARVNKFYLFFDFLFPFANIAKFAIFKKKVGATEYGIGWFPFGGYVDIHGMQAEEGVDPNEKPGPDEFRGKKPWQRMIILAGGIIVNFLLAIIIYSMMTWAWGEQYLPAKNAKYGIYCDTLALKIGLQNGDKMLSLDNVPVDDLHKAMLSILLDRPKTIQVERNGEKKDIQIPTGFELKVVDKEVKILFEAGYPFVIDSVVPSGGAIKAGLQKGDSLISLGKDSLVFFQQFSTLLQFYKSKTVSIGFIRQGKPQSLDVSIDADGKMGVIAVSPDKYLVYSTKQYGFFASWGRGFSRTGEVLSSYIKQMRLIFTKVGVSKIGGFAAIAKNYPDTWDWAAFWNITAFISVILAFMNLLPIPVLDGGYMLFTLWEMVTRKKVSDKFMQRALTIGMFMVLALLVLANGNDILRAFR